MRAQTRRTLGTTRGALTLIGLLLSAGLISGCGLLSGGRGEEATATPERVLVPTFTPTPVSAAAPTPEPVAAQPTAAPVAPTEPAAAATETPAAEPTTEPTPEPTATPVPKLIVTNDTANARNGPGTDYGIAGAVTRDQTFDITGKNADGTWWQFCCVNGQQAWIFGELVRTENAESVAVAEDIPAAPAPVAAAPAPVVEAAPAPTEPPAAAPAPEPQAVNAGGCGGDDGCKFHIRSGPTKGGGSGFELKVQLLFVHSGVDGGQPQGDYRLGLEKDGQLITVFADAKSVALTKSQGTLGMYNYEAKIGASDLPNGSVAGTYFFWVLDGNRERDSNVFRIDLAPNEGEIWIEFDQG